jgi:hypothetical protein
MKTLTAHDNEVLRRASDYLDYDVDMLIATAQWLTTGEGDSGLLRNAVLESFLIHARTLIEFLSRTGHRNAVRADHYFEGTKPGTYSPNVSDFLVGAKGKISPHLAHLTTDPLDNVRSTIGWDVRKILLDLWAGLAAFYDAVPIDRVLPDYDQRRMYHEGRISTFQPALLPDGQPIDEPTLDSDFVRNMTFRRLITRQTGLRVG